jgi:hypothetical protein
MKINTTRIITSLLFVFGVNPVFCQEVQFVPLESPEHFLDIYSVDATNFFTVSFNGTQFTCSYYSYLEKKASETEKGVGYYTNHCSFKVMDRKLYLFKLINNSGDYALYAYEYGTDCKPVGDSIVVMTVNSPNIKLKNSNFTIQQSENKEFLSVGCIIKSSKASNEQIVYKVFSKDFGVISDGKYEIPEKSKKTLVAFNKLSEYGDLFFGMGLETTEEEGSEYRFLRVKGDEIKESNVVINQKYLSEIGSVGTEDHNLICTALYSSEKKKVDGALTFKIDFNNDTKINEGSLVLTEEIITTYDENKLSEYHMKNVQFMEGGGLLVLAERSNVSTSYGSSSMVPAGVGIAVGNAPGTSSVSDASMSGPTASYSWGSIIVYRTDSTGKFLWVNKVKKHQISGVDQLGGYSGYINEDTYNIFFNDIQKNFDESGNYVGKPKNGLPYPIQLSYSLKKMVLTRVQVNLATGELVRSIHSSALENGAVADPESFVTDYMNKQLFVYFLAKRVTKFGFMNF